ncbi:cache domain-containing sensor histidine kinase [Paenibacillus marchantiophytorum]|nr:histidine kinase [Paenibacillus marchantiophytorum]
MSIKFNCLPNLLRKSKIKHRLIVSFILLSIIPLFSMTLIAYTQSSEAIHTKIGTYSLQILDQVRDEIKRENRKLDYLSNQVMMNSLVQKNLENATELDAQSVMDTYYEVNQTFSGRKLLNHIKSMQIYNKSKELVYDLGYDKLLPQDIEPLTQMIAERKGNDIWTHVVTQNGVDCIVLAREIHSGSNWLNTVGYIFIAIKESFYSRDIYEDVNMGEGADLFMIDPKGGVLSSRNMDMPVGRTLDQSKDLLNKIAENEKKGKRAFISTWHHNGSLVAYSYDSSARWYLVSTIPTSYLNKETSTIVPYMLIATALCLLFSLLLTFVISGSISNPLQRLTQSMKQLALGNLQATNEDRSQDEIGFLSTRFNTMVLQISNLIEQTRNEQVKKREVELQMLQAQINPHFLFNTLNSLKWTAMLNQAVSVSDGLGALAELLRSTIVETSEMISLRAELDNINNYIVIQRLRYGATFEVEHQIDKGLMESGILKFILQPIVENAIIHGLDEQADHNKIVITAKRFEGHIQINIVDNGKGMSPNKVQQLLDTPNIAKQRLSNIGISNVNERIKLHFGEAYGITIQSEVGRGTSVSLIMPLAEIGSRADE